MQPIKPDYTLIPSQHIDKEARGIAEKHNDKSLEDGSLSEWHTENYKLASDIMNYSRWQNAKLQAEVDFLETQIDDLNDELEEAQTDKRSVESELSYFEDYTFLGMDLEELSKKAIYNPDIEKFQYFLENFDKIQLEDLEFGVRLRDCERKILSKNVNSKHK